MSLKPIELEIELFCRGMRIDPSFHEGEEGRRISRTRAGLGSGLEIIIPSPRKKIWMNVPVVEAFAQRSPFLLYRDGAGCVVLDERKGDGYRIELPPEPAWYSRLTSRGTEMSRVGVLQGNYLGIYVSNRCMYWSTKPQSACGFCTTGKNVGATEELKKHVQDVVEVAHAAQNESGAVFTHFNTGYHFEDQPEREGMHGLRQCEPFVRAVRQHVGGFIGVQAVPVPRAMYREFDDLIDAGVDHFSFCYEFEDPEAFAKYCPGKAKTLGQQAFFDAMEYTSRRLGRGRVSGEIIAGLEPIEATKRGIDRIVRAGAFPTVCIFRPTIGSDLENAPPPDPEAMKDVFVYMHEACREAALPIGILPIEVSLVVQPEETADLVAPNLRSQLYGLRNRFLKRLAKPYVWWKLRPQGRRAALAGGPA